MIGIHPTAEIGEKVIFGERVSVGPYAIIESNVEIGNDTHIEGHAVVKSGTIIGNNCLVSHFAAIGGLPQDSAFDNSVVSGVLIGNNTVIRENVTIHRASESDAFTKIGCCCMLQCGCHVAHDCEVGDEVVLATGAMLGGRVKIGTKSFIGGGAAIHQRVVVGDLVIMSGNSATSLDLPPFTIAADISKIIGLNLIGLKRAKIKHDNILALKICFREFYKKSGACKIRAEELISNGFAKIRESEIFLTFFLRESAMGFAPKRRKVL